MYIKKTKQNKKTINALLFLTHTPTVIRFRFLHIKVYQEKKTNIFFFPNW